MDEILIRILTRLVRVYDELGEPAFEDAGHRAMVAIARSVQVEANRRAGVPQLPGDGTVVPFPLGAKFTPK